MTEMFKEDNFSLKECTVMAQWKKEVLSKLTHSEKYGSKIHIFLYSSVAE